MQQQAAAMQKANIDRFMLATISRVYAALIAKHGDAVPLDTVSLEELAGQAQKSAIVLGKTLGIIRVTEPPEAEQEK